MWRWIAAGLLASVPAGASELAAARSEFFEVWSEVGAQAAVQAARHLEQLRVELEAFGVETPEERLRVLLLERAGEALPHDVSRRATMWRSRGVSVRGGELTAILVGWNAPGDPLVALGHEYAHQVEALGRGELPLYLREGLAELVGRIGREEGQAVLGWAAAPHVALLEREEWVGWKELAAAEPGSPAYAAETFYAQSWLVAHWLVSRSGLREVAAQLLREEFTRMGAEGVGDALRAHLAELGPIAREEVAQGSYSVEAWALGAWQIPTFLAELRVRLEPGEEARPELEMLRERFPLRPEPAVAWARWHLARNETGPAREWLARAARLGMTDARGWYQLGLLRLDPEFDRPIGALAAMRWAQRLAPDEPLYRLGVAQAATAARQWALSERVLLGLLDDDDWEQRAREEWAYLDARRTAAWVEQERPEIAFRSPEVSSPGLAWRPPKVAQPGPQPKPRVAWPPPGSILLAGRVVHVECAADGKRLTFRTRRSRRVFLIPAGRTPAVYNAPSEYRDLPCGPALWRVNLAYRPDRSRPGVGGVVTGIVF